MSKIERVISRQLLAALLVLSAAFCALAQSRAVGREQQTRDQQPAVPTKQNTRQTGPPNAPAKQNERVTSSQTTQAQATQPDDAPDAPHYVYEFQQPDFVISHILIEHDERGHGRISFERRGGDEPVVEPLEISAAALARIAALWESLRFLDSDAKYQTERQYPHMGTVRLRLKRGTRERVAEFNWTDDKDAFALANEYRRLSDQAILVFDISLARAHEPLNAPKLMDQFEIMLKRNGLSDPQQLLPLLTDLSTDESIPLIARNHAGRLLKQIKK